MNLIGDCDSDAGTEGCSEAFHNLKITGITVSGIET